MKNYPIRSDWLSNVRSICLSLPDAEEIEWWDQPTFRVRKRLFATIGVGEGAWLPDGHPGKESVSVDNPTSVTFKPPDNEREALLTSAPSKFYTPKYIGHQGWISTILDNTTDWEDLELLVVASFKRQAPKSLVKRIGHES